MIDTGQSPLGESLDPPPAPDDNWIKHTNGSSAQSEDFTSPEGGGGGDEINSESGGNKDNPKKRTQKMLRKFQ